ncbi:MAG: MFS transporter, partial [Congregibacter sp.]|nr:MFS transporter [Congregibacter sp.]
TAAARSHEGVGANRNMFRPVLADPVLQRLNGSVFLLHFMLTASFLVVPSVIEGTMGVPRDSHWQVYLPVLAFSLLGMYPFLRLSEKGGRPGLALKITVLMMPASLAALFLGKDTVLLYAGLCGFFTAVNYLEAALPSLVSKAVFAHGKGTALGVYATCQFLGAFVGGTTGGFLYGSAGLSGLLYLVLIAAALWLMLIWRMAPEGDASRAASSV